MKTPAIAGSIVAAAAAIVSADVITLQQGQNGYSGCNDTYITRHYAKIASGCNTAKTITTAYANYNWLGSGW